MQALDDNHDPCREQNRLQNQVDIVRREQDREHITRVRITGLGCDQITQAVEEELVNRQK